MSSTAPPTASPTNRPAPRKPPPAWLREPLLHFLVLGAVLFAADHVVFSRADDPNVIVMDAAVDRQARDIFKASRNREPTSEELASLRGVWLDNEVLYREGLALQVDRGDTAIRERVIFKALSVIDAGVKLPPFDDAVLRAWFEKNRVKYDEPARFDFREAVPSGDTSEAAVRGLVDALNAGTPGDGTASLRVFKRRPHINLVESYGREFAQSLEAAPTGEWRLQAARGGAKAIRLDATTPARPADFEVLRGVVLQDWTDATMAEQRSAAVRVLAKKYKLKTDDEGAPPVSVDAAKAQAGKDGATPAKGTAS